MVAWAEEIGKEIELGDKRLKERPVALMEAFAERPASSIPEACRTWAATHAAYLFFDNEAAGQRLQDLSLEEQDALWERAKAVAKLGDDHVVNLAPCGRGCGEL